MNRIDLFDRARGGIKKNLQHRRDSSTSLDFIRDRYGGEILSEGSSTLLKIEYQIPFSTVHGNVELKGMCSVANDVMSVLLPVTSDAVVKKISVQELLFFDIETTGLSGGAGTYAFLIGFLKPEAKGIVVTQYFLNSLSSEKLFLKQVKEHLTSSSVLISYNGKSFDFTIIRNRYIVNGFSPDDINPLHLDLLYSSRRIWKGLFPDYSLNTVERMVLGFDRREDIPGFRIPDVYFDFLKGRDIASDLLAVFRHNKFDIISIMALFIKQCAIIEAGMEGRKGGNRLSGRQFNPSTLSDLLIKKGYTEEAKSILGDNRDDTEALKRLGLLLKKQKQAHEAVKMFKMLSMKAVRLPDYLFACIEIAKLYEHVVRDYGLALTFTEKALKRLERSRHLYPNDEAYTQNEKTIIEKRLSRLRRKISSHKSSIKERWGK